MRASTFRGGETGSDSRSAARQVMRSGTGTAARVALRDGDLGGIASEGVGTGRFESARAAAANTS